jgi:rubredoxin
MSIPRRGSTPLDRLRAYYEGTEMRCLSCGYEDREGDWRVSTTGGEVRYEHTCPSCGVTESRVITNR